MTGGIVLAAVAALSSFAAVRAFDGSSAQESRQSIALAYAALPAAPAPAFRIPTPRPLARAAFSSWSTVVHAATVRSAASSQSAPVMRLSTTTPEGTANVVLVIGRVTDASGRVWARIRLPILPNNSVGWLPRSALSGYHVVRTRLVIDREQLQATLWLGAREVFRAPVGVGRPEWPTPPGHFYIRDRIRSLASPFYGPVAFGTSARSSVLTDWPAGGFIGIHGTSEPGLVPGRISHGCIRMRNEDILRLARLMPVGTPLTIV
jgi:lipoprotein-anchoring transpeptidase ErfK/SrfK